MTDTSVKIALVVAAAENNVIGRNGGLPWHVPSDLKFFRKTTLGKPIVMGRKTFQSIGKPLDGRPNIVISRDPGFVADGAYVAVSLDEGLEVARTMAADLGQDEIAIIGGAQIYTAILSKADRIYLTRIHAEADGDAVFPPLAPDDWKLRSTVRHEAGPRDDHPFSIMVYERQHPV